MRLSKIHANTLYTLRESAELLEYSPDSIWAALKKGRLIGYKVGGNGNWRIKGSDLMDFILNFPKKSDPIPQKHD